MMEKILLNVLLLLGVVWMLLGIAYFCIQFFSLRKKERTKKEGNTISLSPEREQKKEENAHVLVGRSKPFISLFIPEVPAVSPSEKSVENPDTFAQRKAPYEQKTPEDTAASEEAEKVIEEGENEMQISYTMDEPDEEMIIREELLIADEAMPEITPTAILSRDIARVSGWSRKDDLLDEEDESEVRETLRTLRGSELMEYLKEMTLRQEQIHRKLLAAIRKAEEEELQADSTLSPSGEKGEKNKDETDDRPLSYYL